MGQNREELLRAGAVRLESICLSSTISIDSMDTARISEFLQPFIKGVSSSRPATLSELQLKQISTYIDILLKWNARINLTAIREPEEIVIRHFGESLFAARLLFPESDDPGNTAHPFVDVGSGSGFPGLPIKIWAPAIHATLIESNQKKATFLREICRSITLTNINIFSSRADGFPDGKACTITLRAVERFETILPNAIRLLVPNGRLALLIGEAQVKIANEIAPQMSWQSPIPIPMSANRVILVGKLSAH